jgi:fatty-acyl-CoA synthase
MNARLIDLVAGLVREDPSATVLYDGHAGAAAPDPVTRAELWKAGSDVAEHLRRAGVGEGDCVAVWLPNWSTAVAAQLGALSLGAHVVGLNTRYNSDEISHVLEMARPTALLVAHGFHRLDLLGMLHTSFDAVAVPPPAVLVVTAPGEQPAADPSTYDLGAGAVAFAPCDDAPSLTAHPVAGLATSFTTSGSTGRSKVAAHSEAGIVQHSHAVAQHTGIRPGDTVLGVLPVSGVFGFTPTMAALLSGASTLLEPVFDARGVLDDMVACGVTHAAGADDLFGKLRAGWQEHRVDLDLRWIGIADFEGRSREIAAWARHEFGAWVGGVYGSSETFALMSFWREGTPEELAHGGGGQLVSPDIEWRLVDPDTLTPVEAGGEGELQLRGYNVVDAYLGDQSLSEGVFTDDGWFRTGDLARGVDDDSFTFVCRMGDVLRLHGFLVDPSEIEVRLHQHPAVALAKVVGVVSETGASSAVGFVTLRPGVPTPTDDELRGWCAQTLAKFKVPAAVHVLEEMPTTSGTNGVKVRAAALRELAAQRLREVDPMTRRPRPPMNSEASSTPSPLSQPALPCRTTPGGTP